MVDMVPYVPKGKESTMKFSTVLACSAVVALMFAFSAFGEDAYIENVNGNQYFNTGHFIGPHTRIEMDFQLLEVTGQIRPFGVLGGDNATHPYCEIYLGQAVTDGPYVWSYVASKSDYTSQAYNVKAVDAVYDAADCNADLQRHKIVFDLNSSPKKFEVWTGIARVINKELANVSAGTQVLPLGIFAKCRNASGVFSSVQTTYERPAKMRLYSFRIYESGTLVKEFLPYVKGGVAGLKETFSGQFHTGENARACVAGGDVTIEKDDPYVFFPDNDVMQGSAVAGKSQCFSTGYTFKPNSRMELDYALLTPDWTTSSKWANETHVFYASGNGFMLYLMPYGKSSGYYYYKVGTSEDNITSAGLDYAYNVRRKVSASANNILMETAGYTNFNITSTKPVTANLNSQTILLGLRASNMSACPMKIYGLKIFETENGVESLVRDYVPTVSNSVSLLVDRLNPSAASKPTVQGSSTRDVIFEYGGDTGNDEGAGEAYLDFDKVNGHGLDTGYVITKDSCIEMDFAIWNTNVVSQQYLFEQRGYNADAAQCNGVWVRLYSADNGRIYGYRFYDYADGNSLEWSGVPFGHGRVQFKFDGPNNYAAGWIEGNKVWETSNMAGGSGRHISATTCTETFKIGSNWSNRDSATGMRLYNLKIYKSGVLDRNYVPCATNGVAGLYELCEGRFYPVTGGKVRGATLKGQTFQIAPQPAKIDVEGTNILKCVAAGAQSYEWYEDGKKLAETSDFLTVPWTHRSPHTRIYSVVPVYVVGADTIRGTAASATVEMTLRGMVISVR